MRRYAGIDPATGLVVGAAADNWPLRSRVQGVPLTYGGALSPFNRGAGLPIGVPGAPASDGFSDTFDGADGDPLDSSLWTEYNSSVIATREQRDGRFRAVIDDNTGDQTLWYLSDVGWFAYQTLTFPFEIDYLNIGIGKTSDSQAVPVPGVDTAASPWQFGGVVVHSLTPGDLNYRLMVVGHRDGFNTYTYESKNSDGTGFNSIVDGGANAAPLGRLDIKVIGNANQTITFQHRQPGVGSYVNSTVPAFRFPTYASTCLVGLVGYTFALSSMPFVITCDEVSLVSNGA